MAWPMLTICHGSKFIECFIPESSKVDFQAKLRVVWSRCDYYRMVYHSTVYHPYILYEVYIYSRIVLECIEYRVYTPRIACIVINNNNNNMIIIDMFHSSNDNVSPILICVAVYIISI